MSDELFALQPSAPPYLAQLRRAYDEAKAAYDKASANEDETGEAVPAEVRRKERDLFRRLQHEEAREATTGFCHE